MTRLFLLIFIISSITGCGGGTSKAKYSDFDTPRAHSTAK